MPVHCSNCAQDFCSEFDSGLMIDPKIVTVPLAPAYELNCAQAPDSAAPLDELEAELPPALLLVLLLLLPPLLQAASASTEAPITAAAAADRLFIPVPLLQLAHACRRSLPIRYQTRNAPPR